MRHEPGDHGNNFNYEKRGEVEASAGATSNDEPNASSKLTFSSIMNAALFIIGMLTEEQAEAIAQETQTRLPKDF